MVKRQSKDGSRIVTDEKINTISHLFGAVFAILGISYLIVQASIIPDAWKIVSFSIYGFGLIFLFLFSCLHHAINASKKIEQVLRTFDYIGVFLLIFGTFAAVCLTLIRNPIGWTIFGVVLATSIVGISLRSSLGEKMPKYMTSTLYITMGWIGAFLGVYLWSISLYAFLFLLIGGLFYTLGFIIYISEKPNLIAGKFAFHELWHIFVLLGAASHFAMMVVILNL